MLNLAHFPFHSSCEQEGERDNTRENPLFRSKNCLAGNCTATARAFQLWHHVDLGILIPYFA